MELIILTPGKTVFSGAVKAINTPGTSGKLEILENHAPIVASLKEGKITVTTDTNEVLEYTTSGGFLEVLSNNVSILLETVEQ
ncbi:MULTISPECIES: ATP synthase F1 subunit epsilon [unclassified Aureispira]|uniref:ATP synthase F1 subunit epsilon n=1 Tax=unclassified Aureispira TaxID=2649989 RepID=UPI0006991A5F|nr:MULTISPECIES: ATP synthase F1 subunit epsilon [unclassified Aureispira]WMX14545.1 ATP synthase F1 subunit epsilon [Aureispira sp. CCB-E]